MMYLKPALLFFLLSPGVLLTIPAGSKGLLLSGQTSLMAVLVHTVLFAGLLYWLKPIEFFSSQKPTMCKKDTDCKGLETGGCFCANGECGGGNDCVRVT